MDVFDLGGRAFLVDAAISAAHELGVFAALPGTVAALAARLGVAPRRLRALLDVLVVEGALSRDGDRLRAGAVPARPPDPPRAGWGRLAEVVRADRPLDPLASADDACRRLHEHLLRAGAQAARELAPLLPAGHLLDAGGGAGAYTAAYLEAHPDARATLVDRPEVLALARQALAHHAGRVRLVPGDLLAIDLGHGYDAVLLANVLHLFGPDACRALTARLCAALASGGRLVVKDLRIEPDRSGPPSGVLFALGMALYTGEGTVYDAGELRAFMDGLTDLEELRLETAPDSVVIIGRKKSEADARQPG